MQPPLTHPLATIAHLVAMPNRIIAVLAVLAIATTISSSISFAQLLPGMPSGQMNDEDLVKATILADTAAVAPSQPFTVGVMFKIAPHWHIYWQNAGEGGIPTTIDFQLPEGFTASPLQYPVPRWFSLPGNLFAFGYEDQVLLTSTITPPAKIDSSNITIAADANWLVCDKVCKTGDAKLTLSLPVIAPAATETHRAAASDHIDIFKTWSARLPAPIASSPDVASHETIIESNRITIRIDWKIAPPTAIEWFPPASDALNFTDIRIETKDRSTTIRATIDRLPGQKIEAKLPDSVVAYVAGSARPDAGSGRSGVAVPIKIIDPR